MDKLDAVATVKARGDQEALALLSDIGSDQPASVTKAAASAIASIQNSLAVWSSVQNAWYGLSLGSVLLLAMLVTRQTLRDASTWAENVADGGHGREPADRTSAEGGTDAPYDTARPPQGAWGKASPSNSK